MIILSGEKTVSLSVLSAHMNLRVLTHGLHIQKTEVLLQVVLRDKKFVLLLMVLVLSLVLTGCFAGSNSPSESTYSISGQVVDAETEEGVEGITIVVAGQNVVAETDEEGRWTLDGVKGEATIVPTAKGYTFEPPSRVATLGTRGQDFDFVATREDGVYPPTKEYSLFGRVTKDGEPFNDVIILFDGEHISAGLSTLPGLGDSPDGVWQQEGLKGPITVSLVYNLPSCTFTPTEYHVDPNDDDFHEYRSKLDFEVTCN